MKKAAVFLVLILAPLGYREVQAKDIDLKWKPISGARSYHLEVSKSENFEKLVLEKTLKKNTLKYSLDSGMYYLRVCAIDERERLGRYSKPFKLVVTSPIKVTDQGALEKPNTLSYTQNAPTLETSWLADDGATGFHVIVEKDGKEIFARETSDPKINFKPTEPGTYKFKVSAKLGRYLGPQVLVNVVTVEKQISEVLPAPAVSESSHKRVSSKRPLNLAWKPIVGAHSYSIKVYKLVNVQNTQGRAPSSVTMKQLVAVYPGVKDPNFKIPPLPPGRYVASLESSSSTSPALSETSTSTSDFKFDVKRAKPIEFEKLDLAFHYKFTQISYNANLSGSGSTSANTSALGGAGEIKGSMFFPDSDFGVRVDGSWGGYLINNSNVTYSDLSLGAVYQLAKPEGYFKTDFRPFLGARAVTIPITANFTGVSGQVQTYTPTLLGPAAGFDVYKSLSEKFSLLATVQVTTPLTMTSIGSGTPTLSSGIINGRIEAGAGYKISQNYKLVAMLGFQSEQAKFVSGDSSAQSRVETDATSFIIGVETSDDLALKETDRFSELGLSARYVYLPFNYSARLQEATLGSSGSSSSSHEQFDSSMRGAFAGAVEIEGLAWLNHSKNGLRVLAAWTGVTVNGANVSYPEFYAQWAFRFEGQRGRTDWQFNNFLGLRSWIVPDFQIQSSGNSSGNGSGSGSGSGSNGGSGSGSGSSGGGGGSTARLPQILGIAETFQVAKNFNYRWGGQANLEFSVPGVVANKDNSISSIDSTALSGKAEVRVVRTFGEDFSASLGVGFTYNQLKYVAPGFSPGQDSLLQNWSPGTMLGVTYAF